MIEAQERERAIRAAERDGERVRAARGDTVILKVKRAQVLPRPARLGLVPLQVKRERDRRRALADKVVPEVERRERAQTLQPVGQRPGLFNGVLRDGQRRERGERLEQRCARSIDEPREVAAGEAERAQPSHVVKRLLMSLKGYSVLTTEILQKLCPAEK